MIAKIVKGGSFSGIVKYILDSAKNTELLNSEGVRLRDINSIIKSFEMQTELNPRLGKPVYHISLNFSVQDRGILSNELMTQIASEYMTEMGLVDTQFIIGKHNDKDHSHLHIACNRVNNHGRTISDRNDRFRSEKICKELTLKYGLYFAQGKENVKENRLKEPDKSKYEIYNVLKNNMPNCQNWKELIDRIKNEGVDTQLIYKGNTDVVQGVVFSKNGFPFSGSKVDRQFSYSKIDFMLNQNLKNPDITILSPKEKILLVEQTNGQSTNNFSDFFTIGDSSRSFEEDNELNPKKKRKKNNNLII